MKKAAAIIIVCAGALAVLYGAAYRPNTGLQTEDCSRDDNTRAGFILLNLPGAEHTPARPPVLFDHERHVRSIGEHSCRTCHPAGPDNKLIFVFRESTARMSAHEAMHARHDGCIGCHSERAGPGRQTAGPVTCGLCHDRDTVRIQATYVPVLPTYYDPLRDTYHGDCRSCHGAPPRTAEHARDLDWKKMHVQLMPFAALHPPPSGFDYQRHALHTSALEKNCGLCHYLPPEKRRALEQEAKEPLCRDWVLEPDPEGSWREQDFAHTRCINCHFARIAAGKEQTGPLLCSSCHTSRPFAPEQMLDASRPECGQQDALLITTDGAAVMDAVAFNHAAHQLRTHSCRDCHHHGIRSCRECHTNRGDEQGGFVTSAQAFHHEYAGRSCVGCHSVQKQKPDCAGCHQRLPSTMATSSSCRTCHTGSLESLDTTREAPDLRGIIGPDVQDAWHIEKLGDTYAQARFNHLAMTRALAEMSEASSLARSFHTDTMFVCAACHHHSPLEPEQPVPACRTCHDSRPAASSGRPDLLGAYHQQCLGCHRDMDGTEETMPRTCEGCHAQPRH